MTESRTPKVSGTDSSQSKPDFSALLQNPIVPLPLPADFNVADEAEHLNELLDRAPRFQLYRFLEFIHAGGSGMVFRVVEINTGSEWAAKIARKKAFQQTQRGHGAQGATTSQSPFSDTEIAALAQVSHPNLVSLKDRIVDISGTIIALITTYVHRPRQLDEYLHYVLSQEPTAPGISAFSPERLDRACTFLLDRCKEIASALSHMHEKALFHCDVKPANIVIESAKSPYKAVLTDLGSTIHYASGAKTNPQQLRVRFTWTYAHPELRDLGKEVRSISGGGLKVSVNVDPKKSLDRFDLFAFGRTIQEALAILVTEFGERCYASYGFRFLHLIACLLLDGSNAPIRAHERIPKRDGRFFVSDVALDYPVELFERHRILHSGELLDRLNRFGRDYSWNRQIPELDDWQPEYVNTGCGRPAPYTERVAAILDHPSVRRLRAELQLGWVRDIYPGATHTRWTHTLGVFANVIDYYNALIADPELPTVRILLEEADVETGLVAAMLHDIGQTAFAHDLEAVNKELFDHERIIPRLLFDRQFGPITLASTIENKWPTVDLKRVLAILGIREIQLTSGTDNIGEVCGVLGIPQKPGKNIKVALPPEFPVDGLAKDMINGPIDADKLDYLVRDSLACGVHYGLGIDRARFLRSLTVHVKPASAGQSSRLALAYRAKGAAAIESLLLARYQLYGSVYWHHTFRCIQAMLVHAAARTLQFEERSRVEGEKSKGEGQKTRIEPEVIKERYYQTVVCRRPRLLGKGGTPPPQVSSEPALEFIWSVADQRNRRLIERIASRQLYKRAFETRPREHARPKDYSALQQEFAPGRREAIAKSIETLFLRSIERKIAERYGPTESISEAKAREIAAQLQTSEIPLIVIDYPILGVPDEANIPAEIGDAFRKYISGPEEGPIRGRAVFDNVRHLQIDIATVRVFAEPTLHQLIIRYLNPDDVRACVFDAMPFLRRDT